MRKKKYIILTIITICCLIFIRGSVVKANSNWKLIYQNDFRKFINVVDPSNNKNFATLTGSNYQIRDINGLNIIKEVEFDFPSGPSKVITYPNENRFIVGSYNGLYLYNFEGNLLSNTDYRIEQNRYIRNISLSPSGNKLILDKSSFDNNKFIIVDAKNFKKISSYDANFYKGELAPRHYYIETNYFLTDNVILLGFKVRNSKPEWKDFEGEFFLYNLDSRKIINRYKKSAVQTFAFSKDRKLALLNNNEIINIEDGTVLAKLPQEFNNFRINRVVFQPNSTNIAIYYRNHFDSELAIYDYKKKTLNKILSFSDKTINNINFNEKGTRLFITGSTLLIFSNQNEEKRKVVHNFKTAYTSKETPLYKGQGRSSNYKYTLPPNHEVKVDTSLESYNGYYYWAKVEANIDGENKILKGYINKDKISFKEVTTLEDFDEYEKTISNKYKEANNWEDFLYNPSAYKGYYININFSINSNVSINYFDDQDGVWLDLTNTGYGRFIIKVPFKEIEQDWRKGWTNSDKFHVYMTFSNIGEFKNNYGQVFKIPIFEALAIYDGYRFIK